MLPCKGKGGLREGIWKRKPRAVADGDLMVGSLEPSGRDLLPLLPRLPLLFFTRLRAGMSRCESGIELLCTYPSSSLGRRHEQSSKFFQRSRMAWKLHLQFAHFGAEKIANLLCTKCTPHPEGESCEDEIGGLRVPINCRPNGEAECKNGVKTKHHDAPNQRRLNAMCEVEWVFAAHVDED